VTDAQSNPLLPTPPRTRPGGKPLGLKDEGSRIALSGRER
jgi:hypothetical protein